MIPLIVAIVGISVSVLCLYVLKRTGAAAWNRKMKEAAEKDGKHSNSIG